MGSMLIQSDPRTGEPLLLHCKLPHSVISSETSKDIQVLLMDSQMGTGAAARKFPSRPTDSSHGHPRAFRPRRAR